MFDGHSVTKALSHIIVQPLGSLATSSLSQFFMNRTNHAPCRLDRAIMLGSAALSIAFVFGSNAPMVHAGCGAYVVIGNPLHQTQIQTALELPSVMPMEHTAPRPCHGPGCQQGEHFPPSAVPMVITFSPEFVAIPPRIVTVHTGGASSLDARIWHRVLGVFDRVERPPRVASQTSFGLWHASA